MKLSFCSDLHLESTHLDESFFKQNNSDILLIAGDIAEVKNIVFRVFDNIFQKINDSWKSTYIINGNHEFYGMDYIATIQQFKSYLKRFPNIHLLTEDKVSLSDDWCLIGSTLWTNFKNADPIVMMNGLNSVNDYKSIYHNGSYITPEFILSEHERQFKKISSLVNKNKNKNIILMTHHASSLVSCREYSNKLDYVFASDLSEFILDNPNIKLFVHGHVHSKLDYMIGDCRIVCNPRGYSFENRYKNYKPQIIEL